MNVRHYLARGASAMAMLAIELGMSPAWARERGLRLRVVDQHIRFARELAPGTPFEIFGGVLERRGPGLRVLLDIRHSRNAMVAATMVNDVVLSFPDGSVHPIVADPEFVALPEYASPRGVTFGPPAEPLTRKRADELMLPRIQLGAVPSDDCDAHGVMREESVISRIWDGLPHLNSFIRTGADPKLGGAALEYRIVYRRPARAGDVLEVRSGLRAIGPKTTSFNYYLFDVVTDEPVAAAASVGVAFDLATRRAVAPDEVTMRLLESQLVPEVTV